MALHMQTVGTRSWSKSLTKRNRQRQIESIKPLRKQHPFAYWKRKLTSIPSCGNCCKRFTRATGGQVALGAEGEKSPRTSFFLLQKYRFSTIYDTNKMFFCSLT